MNFGLVCLFISSSSGLGTELKESHSLWNSMFVLKEAVDVTNIEHTETLTQVARGCNSVPCLANPSQGRGAERTLGAVCPPTSGNVRGADQCSDIPKGRVLRFLYLPGNLCGIDPGARSINCHRRRVISWHEPVFQKGTDFQAVWYNNVFSWHRARGTRILAAWLTEGAFIIQQGESNWDLQAEWDGESWDKPGYLRGKKNSEME